jgi:uracil-DNA glycosylase family 4
LLSQQRVLEKLSKEIISCEKCPRLRDYCKHVGRTKRRAYMDWQYWEKPLPGFGDPYAELLIVGLAPAANGGTRTGRMFCGDSSGDWVIKALYETGFANQSTSTNRNDGLKLKGAYIGAVARCAPPENKPTREEIANCLPYLRKELAALHHVKVVLVLGQIALNGFLSAYCDEFHIQLEKKPKFSHGAIYDLGGPQSPRLYVSYHPSRRNTQTKMLTWQMWIKVFKDIRQNLNDRNMNAAAALSKIGGGNSRIANN